MPRNLRAVAVTLGVVALSGCNWYYNTLPSPDDLMKLVPWFDHMIKSPAVHPYKRSDVPRNSVPGTVPVTGSEGDWFAEWTNGNFAVADQVLNPTDPAATLAVGDSVYQIFCATCHGQAGAADGPVGPKVGSPSLLTDRARALSDGHIYSVVRYGRGVMPRYGDKVYRADERWAVVNYVRKLQADAVAAAAAAAPAPGGTP